MSGPSSTIVLLVALLFLTTLTKVVSAQTSITTAEKEIWIHRLFVSVLDRAADNPGFDY
jgi:hypothetical protein